MGLINHLLSVIVSRQMNPTIGCSCPPEPPVQDDEPVAFADTRTLIYLNFDKPALRAFLFLNRLTLDLGVVA